MSAGEVSAGDLDIPPPPWARPGTPAKPAKPRRPARQPLDQEAVLDAATKVLERDGAGGLTMRRVADELGVAAASLYGHIANKEQLIQLLLDRLFADFPTEFVGDTWQEQMLNYMRTARRLLKSRRGMAELTMGRIPLGPNFVVQLERMLKALKAARLPDRIAAYAGDLAGLYLGAYVYEESMWPARSSGAEETTMMREWFASLPADRFPTIVAMAAALTEGDADERFELGAEVLIRGLASFAEKRRR